MDLKDVNLVPASVLARRYAKLHAIGWGIAYTIVTILLLGGYLFYNRSVMTRRHPSSEAQLRKRLAETIAEIATKKDDLERLAFVRDVSRPVGTAQILGSLAELMDPKVWLSELSLSARAGSDTEITMQGLAISNSQLGQTIKRLTESAVFRDVVLVRAAELPPGRNGPGEPSAGILFHARANAVTE